MEPSHLIAADLRALVRGAVLDDAAQVAHYARDNGGIRTRWPAAVVRPAHRDDVPRVLRYAGARGIPVATRSGGHSLSGQTLSTGIVLDMASMRDVAPVERDSETFDAAPGASWRDVVAASLPRGLVPPVLTGTLLTTVGGTHSVGGLGHASFRHGAQVDHCAALEIATVDGDVRWCSDEHKPALFHHALAGLGQLGVITRVRGRLRRHEAMARYQVFLYTERARMLADMSFLAAEGNADELGGYGTRVNGKWLYSLSVTTANASLAEAERRDLRHAMHFDRQQLTVDRPFADYVLRGQEAVGSDPRNRGSSQGNPWVDALMPSDTVDPYCRRMLGLLPQSLQDRCTLLFWPLDERRLTRPMFRSPRGTPVTLASIFPLVTMADLPDAAARMSRVSEHLTALGGKRYLYGWVELDHAGWAEHFGDAWEPLCALKERYDPGHVLNPGFIEYASAPAATSPVTPAAAPCAMALA